MFGILLPKVPHIQASELKSAMDTAESYVLLDVRTPAEYARGKIAGSINVSVDDVVRFAEQNLPDKQAKIYVYCLSGSRSVYAVAELVKLGYTQVFDVQSGLLAWRGGGYPTVA